ncbi:MAG: DUF177 domain-containing protein [Porphyromonas sp.]|nr:DUF177 domain-containing protein [Porphyromonas sp.]
MANRESYILDFTHLAREGEVHTYHLDDRFWQSQEQEQIMGGDVELEVTITTQPDRIFDLTLSYQGVVTVPCDRCLLPLEVPISFEDSMRVSLGAETDDEDDEHLILDEQDPVYDFSFIFYELVVVHLPLQMMHDIEDCDPEMTKYLVDQLPDEEQSEVVEIDPQLADLRDRLAKSEKKSKKNL